ncbi:MAG: hypothetical protein H7X92_14325 [Chitinophagales bacterium]|nr:hypothetical protein [Hyphomicrobiales bacterium]
MFLMLFVVVGLGGMLRYVSQPVLSGFTAGLALLVTINQLPLLLGVQLEQTSSSPELIWVLTRKIGELNMANFAIALMAVVLLTNRVRVANGVARLFGCKSVVARWTAQVSPLMVIAGGAVVVSVGDMN